MSLENRPPPQVKPLYASCVKTVDQEELLQLQSQVQSLTTQQRKMTEEKEKEKRKCNLLLGNLEESESESSAITTQKVKDVFDKNMKIHTTPQYVTRIGKATAGRNRLILIKMNSFEEKLKLLKRARSLSGTGLFLMEDMSKKEKEKRRILVIAMKKKRRKGNRAYIRHSDGKLIVNGLVFSTQENSPEHSKEDSTPICEPTLPSASSPI